MEVIKLIMQEDKRSALLIFCMMREMIVNRKPQNSKQEIVNIKTKINKNFELYSSFSLKKRKYRTKLTTENNKKTIKISEIPEIKLKVDIRALVESFIIS